MHSITVNNLHAGYNNGFALQGVSFSVLEGSFLGIIGPNGSGKSTLFKTIMGDIPITNGSVEILGKNARNYSLAERAQTIAIVSQFTDLAPLTVNEYVLMGRMPYRKPFHFFNTQEDKEIADFYMQKTGVYEFRNKMVTELSGGEMQMVSIACALTQQPKILLLDEATSHLDISHQISLMNLLQTLHEDEGITIVMIIHDLNIAAEYCSQLVMLQNGTLYTQGTPQEVLTYQNIEEVYKTVVLVKDNPISCKPSIFPISERRLQEFAKKQS